MPPIDVFDTGNDHDVLADGYHRVEAFLALRGVRGAPETIEYVRREGSRLDAWLHAVSANDAESLSYTPDDRANMVMRGWREYGLTTHSSRSARPCCSPPTTSMPSWSASVGTATGGRTPCHWTKSPA